MIVRPLVGADIEPLWELAQRTPKLFLDEVPTREKFDAFLGEASKPYSFWVLVDKAQIVGCFGLTNIVPKWSALLHNIWFDGQLTNERARIYLDWMARTMDAFELLIVRGYVAGNRLKSIQWLMALGGHLDGVLRWATTRADGSLEHVACLSITREELAKSIAAGESAAQMERAALAPPPTPEERPEPPPKPKPKRRKPKRKPRSPFARFTRR